MDPNASEFLPFSIGDVDPNGPFTHIFDDVTLDIVMDELDTITDFTRYLQKKAEFIRSGRLVVAHGEEDLLAYYMTKMNSRGEHDFIHPEGRDWRPDDRVVFDEGHYSELSVNPRYIAKRRADGDSYVWDELIKAFTTHMMAGTTIVQKGHKFVLADHEAAIRYMALQDRFRRRILGSAILDAVQKSGREQRFVRALIPGPGEKDRDTGFFFLMLAYPEDLNLSGGYEQYRELRLSMLKAYALNFLKRYSFLKRIIGIATEPPTISTGRPGSSEDLIFLEPEKWTDELHADANRFAEVFDIMRKGRFREAELGGDEFPRD